MTGVEMKQLNFDLGAPQWNSLLNAWVEYDNEGRIIKTASKPANLGGSPGTTKNKTFDPVSTPSVVVNAPVSPSLPSPGSATNGNGGTSLPQTQGNNTYLYLIIFGIAAVMLMNQ